MRRQLLDKLTQRRQHLAQWLERHKQAAEAVPLVRRNLELTDWQIEALQNAPPEAEEVPLPNVLPEIERTNESILGALPMIPAVDLTHVYVATSGSTSGASDIFVNVVRIGEIATGPARAYSAMYADRYRAMQAAQQREQEVRQLLSDAASKGTVSRFDVALATYNAYRAGTATASAAATEIRNLLDGVQGDLFQRAREWDRENMTWEKMSRRLARRGQGSTPQERLSKQGFIRTSLMSRLGDVIHARSAGGVTDVGNLWVEVLDHLYVILASINQSPL